MKNELLQRALQSTIPKSKYLEGNLSQHRLANPQKPEDKRMHSGTTVLALHYSDGVLFAADRKTSNGYLGILSVESIKIHPLSNYSIIGCAGTVSDIQMVVATMQEINGGFSSRFGYQLSINGQVNYLSNLLRDFRFYVIPWGLEVDTIVGGFDLSGEFQIYQVWMDGGRRKADYHVIGSGTDHANAVLKANKSLIHQRTLSLSGAVKLAIQAIKMAGESDNGTSDIRIATPSIAVVTENGYREINTRLIERMAAIMLRKERHNG